MEGVEENQQGKNSDQIKHKSTAGNKKRMKISSKLIHHGKLP